ncbi:MAG: hypothetical protein Q4G36_13570, partial [Paracoccus sp. (in: a-proteobacteria)]|nr:hypothetical protein [Paracoccus sp. (in: a-proteobacteria)]
MSVVSCEMWARVVRHAGTPAACLKVRTSSYSCAVRTLGSDGVRMRFFGHGTEALAACHTAC